MKLYLFNRSSGASSTVDYPTAEASRRWLVDHCYKYVEPNTTMKMKMKMKMIRYQRGNDFASYTIEDKQAPSDLDHMYERHAKMKKRYDDEIRVKNKASFI